MDKKERRLVLLISFIALFILLSGCFFRAFLIYIWTSTMQVYTVGQGPYLAVALLSYFFMFGLFGAATGLIVHHHAAAIRDFIEIIWKWLRSWIKAAYHGVKRLVHKTKATS